MPAARELLLLDHIRQLAGAKAFREATEVPLAAAGSHPGRRWTPSETASLRAVDTVGIGLLRVRYGDSADPRFPPPQAVWRARRGAVWHP